MATAGPSRLPSILSGPFPGLLDPSQPSRVLRQPTNRLVFAAFDPRTASAEPLDVRTLSINQELYRPKRVVLETGLNGDSFWRFVPKAKCGYNVQDEGEFPRLVDISGQTFMLAQDQWDIYKLDPHYTCFVHPHPMLSVITRVATTAIPSAPPTPHAPFVKRSIPSLSPEREQAGPSFKRHRARVVEESSSDEDDEDEVEDMIMGNTTRPQPTRAKSALPRREERREKLQKQRKAREAPIAEKIARAEAKKDTAYWRRDATMHDVSEELPMASPHAQSIPPDSEATGKRKVSDFFGSSLRKGSGSDSSNPADDLEDSERIKRMRTMSPTNERSASKTQRKKMERENKKRQEDSKKLGGWRNTRDQRFMADVFADVPFTGAGISTPPETPEYARHVPEQYTPSNSPSKHASPAPEVSPEDAAREATIEESRRKMAALEADRPLWEEAARKRAVSERIQEESAARTKAEALHRATEEKRRAVFNAQAQREQEEAQRRQEAFQREQEEINRRERERRQRQQRWSSGPWTIHRALERYKIVSESFDATKFSPNYPLSFDAVPWPVLTSPTSFSVEDVDWAAVEAFFEAVKPHMRSQDFKTFVSASHKRFHPDRWRSRGLLTSIADEAERGELDVASNTVAQALTPIWRDLKG